MPSELVRPRPSQQRQALRDGLPDTVPAGHWVAATLLLGHEVPVTGPYPHICSRPLPSGDLVTRRQCAACAQPATLEGDPH